MPAYEINGSRESRDEVLMTVCEVSQRAAIREFRKILSAKTQRTAKLAKFVLRFFVLNWSALDD